MNETQPNLTSTTEKGVSPQYETLALSLWQYVSNRIGIKQTAKILGTSEQRIKRWQQGKTPVRTAPIFILFEKLGYSLNSICSAILAPHHHPSVFLPSTELIVSKNIIGPLIKQMRKDKTLAEVKTLLKLENTVCIHHWEKGERDIPLSLFLKCVDLLGHRLHIFCESLDFKIPLKNFNFTHIPPDFSARFFKYPWTPTIYLALQSHHYQNWNQHCDKSLARRLELEVAQVHLSLKVLADLEVIRFNGKTYETRKGAFYAPPTLDKNTLDGLHNFWFKKSAEFYKQPGYHKVDQASVSQESYQKIIGWVSELREKIREEIKTTEPETIIHMHWQVLDLFPQNYNLKDGGINDTSH